MFNSTRVIVLLLALTLTGCASNKAYRSNLAVCQASPQATDSCGQHAIIRNADQGMEDYRLGFIELDDQGQVRDRQQLSTVLDDFRAIAGQHDVLLVTFVHGWHHNAHFEDDNVAQFNRLLGKLAKVEAASGHRKVLGLYLGWRGESLAIPGLRYTTFWERKSTAHKVGTNGAAEVFLKLEEIVNVKEGQETAEPKPRNSRMAIIGHSFGGAVVFTALQQILTDRFVDSRPGKTSSDTAKGFGDLVVLMNPAFEALRYASLYDLSRERCSYFPQQLPKLAILTSEADWATGYAFPAGRFFSTLFETHNTVDRTYCSPQGMVNIQLKEGKADRNTVGHFEPFLTHELHPGAVARKNLTDEGQSFQALKQRWTSQAASAQLDFGDTQLAHMGRTHPLNPYLNIRVDAELIPDHNDIWDDRVVNFIRDLIALSTLPISAVGQ